jgi:allophanate hydrolase subunit 2
MPIAEHLLSPNWGEGQGEGKIRVILGPQADRFTDAGIAAFLNSDYEMLPQSDRMGARLRGAPIAHVRGHDIVSDGIALGSVQVAGDGQPIVLLVDRQSTGGYTKIATVCSFDIGRIAQTRPGQVLQFRAITLEEAHGELKARQSRGCNNLSDPQPPAADGSSDTSLSTRSCRRGM